MVREAGPCRTPALTPNCRCGHCVQMAPAFKALAELLFEQEVDIELAVVNCDLQQALCAQMGVSSFPSLRLFVPSVVYPISVRATQEPSATLLWATRGGGEGTDALAHWARSELDAYSRSACTHLADSDAFDDAVLHSEPLWLVLFLARSPAGGSAAHCPACAQVEPAFRRMASGVHEWRSPQEAHVRFGAVDCEEQAARPLCVRYGLGRPYGVSNGDFPQVLAFPRGLFKSAPERLLPGWVQFAQELTARMELMDRLVRASAGIVPAWARAPPSGDGVRWTTWTRHSDARTGQQFWFNPLTQVSTWQPPKGWHSDGPDSQTLEIEAAPAPAAEVHDEL